MIKLIKNIAFAGVGVLAILALASGTLGGVIAAIFLAIALYSIHLGTINSKLGPVLIGSALGVLTVLFSLGLIAQGWSNTTEFSGRFGPNTTANGGTNPTPEPGAPPAEPTPNPSVPTPVPTMAPVPTVASKSNGDQDVVVFFNDGEGFSIERGDVTHGDKTLWTIGQYWDGTGITSVVHFVVEPGMALRIPAPAQGTSWQAQGTHDLVVAKANEMSIDAINRDSLPDALLLYVGDQTNVPAKYVTELPNGWCIQSFEGPACKAGQ